MSRKWVSTGKPWETTIPHGLGVVIEGRVLLTSGITARDPEGRLVAPGDMGAQVLQVFRNLEDLLVAAGADFSRVVKYTVFTTDIEAFMAAASDWRPHLGHAQERLLHCWFLGEMV